MKIIFFSDTHWLLKEFFHEIDFSNIELIVFLWDNEVDDLELFKDINIKKIWVLWNHTPYEITRIKIDIFEEYWIENIDWKIFKFNTKMIITYIFEYKIDFIYQPDDKRETLRKWVTMVMWSIECNTNKYDNSYNIDNDEFDKKIKVFNISKIFELFLIVIIIYIELNYYIII